MTWTIRCPCQHQILQICIKSVNATLAMVIKRSQHRTTRLLLQCPSLPQLQMGIMEKQRHSKEKDVRAAQRALDALQRQLQQHRVCAQNGQTHLGCVQCNSSIFHQSNNGPLRH